MIVNLLQLVFLSTFSTLLIQSERSKEVAYAACVCSPWGSVDFKSFPEWNAIPKHTREPRMLLSEAEYCSKQAWRDAASEIASDVATELVLIAIVELFAYAREKAIRRAERRAAQPPQRGGAIQANRDQKADWEFFEIIQDTEGKGWISFRAHTGYLCAIHGGGSGVIADREKIGEWERFKVVVHKDGTYSFQTINGHYLCAEKDRFTLVADRKNIGPWEKFTLEFNKEGTATAIKTAHGKYISAQGVK